MNNTLVELIRDLNFWGILIGAFLAAFLSWLSKHYWLRWEESSARKVNKHLLLVELRGHRNDITFHIGTLQKMAVHASKPSAIHLLKMIVPQDSMVLSIDTVKAIGPHYTNRIAQLRRVFQNRNAELRYVGRCLDDPAMDQQQCELFLMSLSAALQRTLVRVEQCIDALEGKPATTIKRQDASEQTILRAPHASGG